MQVIRAQNAVQKYVYRRFLPIWTEIFLPISVKLKY